MHLWIHKALTENLIEFKQFLLCNNLIAILLLKLRIAITSLQVSNIDAEVDKIIEQFTWCTQRNW